jgi:hypothetical protein
MSYNATDETQTSTSHHLFASEVETSADFGHQGFVQINDSSSKLFGLLHRLNLRPTATMPR